MEGGAPGTGIRSPQVLENSSKTVSSAESLLMSCNIGIERSTCNVRRLTIFPFAIDD